MFNRHRQPIRRRVSSIAVRVIDLAKTANADPHIAEVRGSGVHLLGPGAPDLADQNERNLSDIYPERLRSL